MMRLALPGWVFALTLATLSLSGLAVAQSITQPTTRAEYEAFKTAQGEASNKAYQSGDAARSKAIEEAVLVAARKFGDRDEEASSIYGLAMAALAMGDPVGAEKQFRQCINLWKDIDNQKGVALGLRGLGRVLEARGRLAEATEVQVTALELLLKYGKPIDQSESYYSLAKLFMVLEDYPAARHGVDRAIELMGPTPPDFPLGLNLALRSAVLRQLDDNKGAVADGEAALAAFAREKSRVGEAIGQLALGNALAASGQPERGLNCLVPARPLRAISMRPSCVRICWWHKARCWSVRHDSTKRCCHCRRHGLPTNWRWTRCVATSASSWKKPGPGLATLQRHWLQASRLSARNNVFQGCPRLGRWPDAVPNRSWLRSTASSCRWILPRAPDTRYWLRPHRHAACRGVGGCRCCWRWLPAWCWRCATCAGAQQSWRPAIGTRTTAGTFRAIAAAGQH